MRRTARLVWLVLICSVMTVSSCGDNTPAEGAKGPAMAAKDGSRPAPDFDLVSLDGQRIKLSDYQGKVVLVDFWATWCGPCRMSIPHLVELQQKLGPSGLQVIGISMDQTGKEGVSAFASKYKINYPIVMGTPQVAQSYGGIQSIPQVFLVDRQGKIQGRIVGYQAGDEMEKKVKALL
jgi:cytochrome c biogenesis protein CcmG, thiol:disulfide interchange protein DsbE